MGDKGVLQFESMRELGCMFQVIDTNLQGIRRASRSAENQRVFGPAGQA